MNESEPFIWIHIVLALDDIANAIDRVYQDTVYGGCQDHLDDCIGPDIQLRLIDLIFLFEVETLV